jgi:transcriptional regulator with XRE-family HTH domain
VDRRAVGNASRAAAAELRERRRARGLSLEAPGARSGVGRSMISKVERGGAVLSTVALPRSAEALGATSAQLMMPAPARGIPVIPRARQPVPRDAGAGSTRRLLSPVPPGRGAEECIHVLSGRLEARVGGRAAALEAAGDGPFFDASVAHASRGAGEGSCECLLAIDGNLRR